MRTHDPREAARRRGRTLGIALFAAIVTSITVAWSAQIILQVWTPPQEPTELSCREGFQALLAAVERARSVAALETGGERESLARFRDALNPEWLQRRPIGEECRDDEKALRALRALDRLRYAEEHAVRYEAMDVASRRRRAAAYAEQLSAD